MNWKAANEGPRWLPALNAAEVKYGIPTDLLARQCFEECSFDSAVIDCDRHSSTGAVGIMQLMPVYFPNAGINPFEDIDTAAKYLKALHDRFGDWQLALAAYNWGPGALHHYLEYGGELPAETQKYVAQIVADVPVQGALIP